MTEEQFRLECLALAVGKAGTHPRALELAAHYADFVLNGTTPEFSKLEAAALNKPEQ